MQLRNAITKISGLTYILDELQIQSNLGRRCILDSLFITNSNILQENLDNIECMCFILSKPEMKDIISSIRSKLSQIKDIQHTINKIGTSAIFDDIELFELKHFSLLAEGIRNLWDENGVVEIPCLDKVISILDPDGLKIPSFYIYDSYSKKLAELRHLHTTKRIAFNAINKKDIDVIRHEEANIITLYEQCIDEEDKVRQQISSQLSVYKQQLSTALGQVAQLDILIAKALQAKELSLVKPAISNIQTSYKGIFNPYLKANLEQQNKRYQAVDISIPFLPTLITGANMAGKTVLLKTIALAQYMFQFGFFIPAVAADICIVDKVFLCVDDEQNEAKGLSSFAAEIFNLNIIVSAILNKEKPLVLIDELARTTNPYEGTAIVSGVLDFLNEHAVQSVVTTHYNGIKGRCRRLRVRGLEGKDISLLTKNNINNYMDYSLVENNTDELPMEAIRIAEALDLNKGLLNKIHSYID